MAHARRGKSFAEHLDPALVQNLCSKRSTRSESVAAQRARHAASVESRDANAPKSSSSAIVSPVDEKEHDAANRARDASKRRDEGRSRKRTAPRAKPALAMHAVTDSPLMARRAADGTGSSNVQDDEWPDISDTILDPDTTAQSPQQSRSGTGQLSLLGAALLREETESRREQQQRRKTRLQSEEEKRTAYGSKRRRLERQSRREVRKSGRAATDPRAHGQPRWLTPWLKVAQNVAEGGSKACNAATTRGAIGECTDDVEKGRRQEGIIGRKDAAQLEGVSSTSSGDCAVTASAQAPSSSSPAASQNIDGHGLQSQSRPTKQNTTEESGGNDTQDGYLADNSVSQSKSAASCVSTNATTDTHNVHGATSWCMDGLTGDLMLIPSHASSNCDARLALAKSTSASAVLGTHHPGTQSLIEAVIQSQTGNSQVDTRVVCGVIWRGQHAIEEYFGTIKRANCTYRPKVAPPSRAAILAWCASDT